MRTTRVWVAAATASLVAAALSPWATPATAGSSSGPGAPPIPPDPRPSSLGLVLEEYAQLPTSEPTPAPTDPRLVRHNRINYVGEVPDGSGRLYVPDLNGPLYLLRDGEETTYLDIKARFPDFFSGRGMGSGFGFVTFHPEFADNGKFYTVHSENQDAIATKTPTYPNQPNAFVQSVVTEWTADDPAADTFTGTQREIFRFGFTEQIHAIQQIDFNPTAEPGDEDYGLLYLAVGDGGNGVRSDEPQDLSSPAGKILRIDPFGTDGPNGQYGVPATNPWAGEEGAIGEIWAIGMRDPHRFSWDLGGKNEMYVGHIGQRAIEAVYQADAGDDFGWPDVESRLDYQNETQCRLDPMTPEQAAKGYDFPVASYAHDTPANWSCNADSGHAISGGLVHRGDLPGLKGKYVFGDLVEGKVFYTVASQMSDDRDREATIHEMQLFTTDGRRVRMPDLVGDGRIDLRFGTDSERNLYLLSKANGTIWKVVDTTRSPWPDEVEPALRKHVVAAYDFEHPFAANDAYEEDQGASRTLVQLINGGDRMRIDDGAYPGSNNSLQVHSAAESPTGTAWKAGVYEADADGVASLSRFSNAKGTTVMGWFKMTGQNPTAGYNAIGLAGVLAGNSDGHGVRALLELIQVDGELRLVALGRRLDDGSSWTYAASQPWQELLPQGEWVHLAATFDFAKGSMQLYRNGKKVKGAYTATDPWAVDGTGTSATNPRGIKIGGSFPQNGTERNPCNCRMDALMFLDDAASASEVARQYRRYLR
ncbi:Glucose/arabinose dehydrogenase, beta-propeller fold [Nocardioides exalbidus]|uniref:Glucose/arabinose dehydrogenase, beta-propeller fold n=1 Tax=Nocardioides exalbidus TaxID=402596 RepID=A0A1H4KUV9_9ACTN|nr:PQQ-dependent sugar dehydrogenase [Nocardioides exalbidus]SEB62287.1 Glucose/arabinose dehydrogenase, beta-propeller fold [Nocardioides exalbidus]